jgi:hypothetical protein
MSTTRTSAPRFIIVDDVDPSIQYIPSESWYPIQGSRDSLGNFGPPYQSTLHGVNVNASLSYAFNGEQPFILFKAQSNSNRLGLQDPRSL